MSVSLWIERTVTPALIVLDRLTASPSSREAEPWGPAVWYGIREGKPQSLIKCNLLMILWPSFWCHGKEAFVWPREKAYTDEFLCTAIHRTSISTSTHPRPKEHCGREGRKSVRARGWEGLFSEHGLAIAHMSSQELWLPEQILHNVKYIKCPAWVK